MPRVNVDYIGPGRSAQGEVAAAFLRSGRFDFHKHRRMIELKKDKYGRVLTNQYGQPIIKGVYVNQYVGAGDTSDPKNYYKKNLGVNAAATLTRDEWMDIDNALSRVLTDRLVGIDDLERRGLTKQLDGMANTMHLWQGVESEIEVQKSMNALERAEGARPEYQTYFLPLPFTYADFDIDARDLAVSRNNGNSVISTEMMEASGLAVANSLEDSLFTDVKYSYGGGVGYSYINYPDRKVYTLPKAWDAGDKTGAEILADIKAMRKLLAGTPGTSNDNKFFGPFHIYLPPDYAFVLDDDYVIGTDGVTSKTIRERILQLEAISGMSVADRLPDNNIVMMEMSSRVVELIQGMPVEPIQWNVEGGMSTHYKVMTIQILKIKSTPTKQCGILHAKI